MQKTLNVDLGNVSVQASDTSEILLKKAQQHLPTALMRIGERVGLETWTATQRGLQQGLRGSSLKLTTSAGEKAKFIRDAGREYARTASASDKQQVLQDIFEEIQKQRDAKRV